MSLITTIRKWFAIKESDSTIGVGARPWHTSERDRYPYDRTEVLEQSLEAWRTNPIARRIIGLTTQYVVGAGIELSSQHRKTEAFLKKFWSNPLNRMGVRSMEWCDELSRTGNLFIILSTDAAGMSYVRALPASMVDQIISRSNDIEQPVSFKLKPEFGSFEPKEYEAWNPLDDSPGKTVILHYAINRPAGAQWGEPDLAPLLKWLSRYSNWLEDRARLNRYRNSFLFVVNGKYLSESQRIARQNLLNAAPPPPGSILVCDETEVWSVISPKLESHEAGEDGLALKKMISAGAGIPLHFIAEPESATRTTAEAAGGPTYRHFEQRQQFFLWMLDDILRAVLKRRAYYEKVKPDADIVISGPDISARDNVALAAAASEMMSVLVSLRDRQLIDDSELLRLAYRFSGESVDIEDMLDRGKAAPPPRLPVSTEEPDDQTKSKLPSKLTDPDVAL
jgi:hypothetical protein